jgi:hypothetical protein
VIRANFMGSMYPNDRQPINGASINGGIEAEECLPLRQGAKPRRPMNASRPQRVQPLCEISSALSRPR